MTKGIAVNFRTNIDQCPRWREPDIHHKLIIEGEALK